MSLSRSRYGAVWSSSNPNWGPETKKVRRCQGEETLRYKLAKHAKDINVVISRKIQLKSTKHNKEFGTVIKINLTKKTDLNSFLQRSTMILHFRQNVIEHNVSLTATAINYHFYSAPALQKSIIFCNEPIIKVAQCGKTRNSLIDKIIRQINSLRISLVLKTKNVAFTKKFLDNFVSNFP